MSNGLLTQKPKIFSVCTTCTFLSCIFVAGNGGTSANFIDSQTKIACKKSRKLLSNYFITYCMFTQNQLNHIRSFNCTFFQFNLVMHRKFVVTSIFSHFEIRWTSLYRRSCKLLKHNLQIISIVHTWNIGKIEPVKYVLWGNQF